MNADGSSLNRLTSTGGINTEPAYSHDGRSIYFTSDRGGGPQIYRMSTNGGDAARVTFEGGYNISPRISPDDKTLTYVTRRDGQFRIAALDLAGGTEMLLTNTGRDESPSFAPNGVTFCMRPSAAKGPSCVKRWTNQVHLEQFGADISEPTLSVQTIDFEFVLTGFTLNTL